MALDGVNLHLQRRRPRVLLCAIALVSGLLVASAVRANPFAEPFRFAPPESPINPTGSVIRGALRLAATAPDGHPLHGLSGLAWSPRCGCLYALSDFGYLIKLKPVFAAGRLIDAVFEGRFPLVGANGRTVRGRHRDAEGLALQRHSDGTETLLVSFEQQARIARYTAEGHFLGLQALASTLGSRLQESNPNRGLEGLAWLPHFGLLTSVETPTSGHLEIYAVDGRRRWSFPPAENDGALVALEALRDERLLVLERRYLSPLAPVIITLRRIDLLTADAVPVMLARFSSAEGWPVDNFEAVARHRRDRYFILSDDNANPLQNTLLVYLAMPGTEPR